MSFWKRVSKQIEKLEQISVLAKVVVILGLLLWLSSWRTVRRMEGFTTTTSMETKTGVALYDDLYASIYDRINYDQVKNGYEVGAIINAAPPTSQSVILDVGSGTGHHVGDLTNRGHYATGVDISPSMIGKAKRNYPDIEFVQGDATTAILFHPNAFTHVMCMGFTIYEIANKRQFMQNVYNWLMPGGYFIVHLVDKNNYVPIPHGANPRKLRPDPDSRDQTSMSRLAFKDMTYKSVFDATNKNIYKIDEVMVDTNTGTVRKNEHRLTMDSQRNILNMAKGIGFIMLADIDMMKVKYYNQYIYVLQKPN